MKIHIHYPITSEAFGGGNQFLKALKSGFENLGCYETKAESSDVILFNSFDQADTLIEMKKKFKEKIFVHRVDGPIRLYNSMSDTRDGVVNALNEGVADATVFQSQWSKERNHGLGMKKKETETVIMNAPDPEVFKRTEQTEDLKAKDFKGRKVKIIATSWSDNVKKGFSVYQWCDTHLDFNRFEMTFVGRSPVTFKNIKVKGPLRSAELAQELKASDIYMTASENDPCSNSLLEAIHSGLPALAFNSGGHPEIVRDSGLLFNAPEEIPQKVSQIVDGYSSYSRNSLPSLSDVTRQYAEFCELCLKNFPSMRSFATGSLMKARTHLFLIKNQNRFKRYARKLFK